MAIENSYNFRRVSESLTTSGVVGPNRLKGLSAEGYQVVVNLLPGTSEYAVPGEQDIVESQGVEYVHIPVDIERPTRSDFEQFVAALERAEGKKVHIHCAANYRVSAFYALYARQRGLWDAAEAEAFILDLWEPREYPGWPEFIAEALGKMDGENA